MDNHGLAFPLPGHSWFGLRLKLLFDSRPFMAGNGDRLKPLLRPGPQRQGARPGPPALKRRAIETRTPDQIIWLMTITAGLSKESNTCQPIQLMTISAWLSGSTLNWRHSGQSSTIDKVRSHRCKDITGAIHSPIPSSLSSRSTFLFSPFSFLIFSEGLLAAGDKR